MTQTPSWLDRHDDLERLRAERTPVEASACSDTEARAQLHEGLLAAYAAAGLSVEDAAQLLEADLTKIQQIMKAEIAPLDTLQRLARLVGCRVEVRLVSSETATPQPAPPAA